MNEDDEWEYVEDGPPEIIWQGNEIIFKKKKVRVPKKKSGHQSEIEVVGFIYFSLKIMFSFVCIT